MPKFSDTSMARLREADVLLQQLFTTVIEHRDCTILCGFRDETTQNTLYEKGLTTKRWPDGKHNTVPSKAVDVAPFINGEVCFSPNECRVFAGFVLGVAAMLGFGNMIRCGGDWDGDGDTRDQTLQDLVHFEIRT